MEDDEEQILQQTQSQMRDLTAQEAQELMSCQQALAANQARDPRYFKVVELLLKER